MTAIINPLHTCCWLQSLYSLQLTLQLLLSAVQDDISHVLRMRMNLPYQREITRVHNILIRSRIKYISLQIIYCSCKISNSDFIFWKMLIDTFRKIDVICSSFNVAKDGSIGSTGQTRSQRQTKKLQHALTRKLIVSQFSRN